LWEASISGSHPRLKSSSQAKSTPRLTCLPTLNPLPRQICISILILFEGEIEK
jgi:hypothetical protein